MLFFPWGAAIAAEGDIPMWLAVVCFAGIALGLALAIAALAIAFWPGGKP